MIRESLSNLFTIAIASILAVLIPVLAPLFSTPASPELVLPRFLVASPLITLIVITIIFIVKGMRKVDTDKETARLKEQDEKDKKLIASFKIALAENNTILTKALKEAFLEASKETGLATTSQSANTKSNEGAKSKT